MSNVMTKEEEEEEEKEKISERKKYKKIFGGDECIYFFIVMIALWVLHISRLNKLYKLNACTFVHWHPSTLHSV